MRKLWPLAFEFGRIDTGILIVRGREAYVFTSHKDWRNFEGTGALFDWYVQHVEQNSVGWRERENNGG